MTPDYGRGRPRFELREQRTDGTETIQICTLQEVADEAKQILMNRRGFIGLSTFMASAALVAACGPVPRATATRTAAPTREKTRTRTATPTQEETPTRTATAKTQATPTRTRTPTPAPLVQCTGLHSHADQIESIAFSPDGALVATAGYADKTVKLWQMSDWTVKKTFSGYGANASQVAFSPDGTLLASVGKNVYVRRVADGALSFQLTPAEDSAFSCIAFSGDGSVLAAGGSKTVRLYRVSSHSLLREVKGATAASVAVSPDGKLLAYAGNGKDVHLALVKDGGADRTLTGHTGTVSYVAFSPDGALLASAGAEKAVRLWAASDGAPEAVLAGHPDVVHGIAFSPDGQLLASGSAGTVLLWKVSDGSLVRTLSGPGGTVRSVAFSPDGALVAAGGTDENVHLWQTSDGEPVDACFFDPAATPSEEEANTYRITDAMGVTRSYTLPCGSAIPAGAICTCNCVPGKAAAPAATKPAGGSGSYCSCNKVCTCVPVRKYCFVMFKRRQEHL